MPRKMMDCRDMPSERPCTLVIEGEEEEVVRAAVMHAVDWHAEKDTPELREEVRKGLKPASGTRDEARRGAEGEPAHAPH